MARASQAVSRTSAGMAGMTVLKSSTAGTLLTRFDRTAETTLSNPTANDLRNPGTGASAK